MSGLDDCQVCGQPIKIMVNQHTGICCENCRKKLNDDVSDYENWLDTLDTQNTKVLV